MGYGFPAAIGAQIGNPEKRVIAVSGDGGMQMNIQEFATAVLEETPVIACVFNNTYLGMVRHAGSVFLGYHTCESVGDYFGGCNHVLPTSGTARFSSALGVDSFVKKSSYLHYSAQALQAYGANIIEMAEQEELQAHANAVKVRLKS